MISISPEWLYTRLNIPQYEDIRNELIQLRDANLPRVSRTADYYSVKRPRDSHIPTEILFPNCPILTKYLDSRGIIDIVDRVFFSKSSSNVGPIGPIHVDHFDPTVINCSLNIPLTNAEKSHTAFYNLKLGKVCKEDFHVPYALDNDVEQIDKLVYSTPALMNTTVLHRGITEFPGRVIAGIRFKDGTHSSVIRASLFQ